MKTARQNGWSMVHTVSSSGFHFVTVRNDFGDYGEFHKTAESDVISGSNINNFSFDDLPQSVINLIKLWFSI